MAPNTYSDRVNIIKYVKHADRWRFAPVVRRPWSARQILCQ